MMFFYLCICFQDDQGATHKPQLIQKSLSANLTRGTIDTVDVSYECFFDFSTLRKLKNAIFADRAKYFLW